ncbi:hypothetical protein EDD22DRAFT_885127 [Suillus occidentalis]|nr:hypothetical protein EDD22DRAFT_885127 [Suillus occidentalis]
MVEQGARIRWLCVKLFGLALALSIDSTSFCDCTPSSSWTLFRHACTTRDVSILYRSVERSASHVFVCAPLPPLLIYSSFLKPYLSTDSSYRIAVI